MFNKVLCTLYSVATRWELLSKNQSYPKVYGSIIKMLLTFNGNNTCTKVIFSSLQSAMLLYSDLHFILKSIKGSRFALWRVSHKEKEQPEISSEFRSMEAAGSAHTQLFSSLETLRNTH